MRARIATTILLLAAACLFLPQQAGAATEKSSADRLSGTYIMPFVGYQLFDSKYGAEAFGNDQLELKDNMHYGARLGYLWASGFGVELDGGWTGTTVEDATDKADVSAFYGGFNLLYQFQTKRGGPFVSLGYAIGQKSLTNVAPAGSIEFSPAVSDSKTELNQGFLDYALGWNFFFNEHWGMRIEGRGLSWMPKDDWSSFKTTDFIVGAGISYLIGGKPKDTDRDGVPDKKDKCPDSPFGCKVDENGCPYDADADGVCDGIDQCANTAKGCKVNAQGCPTDADADGVCDGVDQCANTVKGCKVDAKGCPVDSDGDGVCDGADQCPNTAAGCKVDAKGCPVDSDGDGVCDGVDQCPATPAGTKVNAVGCPDLGAKGAELVETGAITTSEVTFATGSAKLNEASNAVLDEVGNILVSMPAVKVEVQGYTDSQGAASFNKTLSQKRAESVQKYLLDKFPSIGADRLTAKGYGEENPVAPNTTAEGRAKNRRVVFNVLNKDALK